MDKSLFLLWTNGICLHYAYIVIGNFLSLSFIAPRFVPIFIKSALKFNSFWLFSKKSRKMC